MRVSQSTTQLDGKILNTDNPLIWDSKGDGTGTFGGNKFAMSVDTGEYFVRQTKRFAGYLSGKSQQVELTFDGFAPEPGVIKRCGYFSSSAVAPFDDDLDGFWFESSNGTISLKVARAGTETLSLPLDAWFGYDNMVEYQNVETWGNFTITAFDFLWLGGAVLRAFVKNVFGFAPCHRFEWSGTKPDVMMLSPNQPLRYEIRGESGAGSFRPICCQTSTEGSVNEAGYNNAANSVLTAAVPSQTAAAIGTAYALCGVRKKATHRDVPVQVLGAECMVRTINDYLRWELVLNPTLSEPLTYTDVPNSACQSGTSGEVETLSITSSGGRVLHAGYLSQGQPIPLGVLDRDFLAFLGCTIDNVMDQIVLVVTPITASISMNGSVNWKEY
jgi:hypothetical protein